ncbi:chorismate-binding protein [bacterium]|nr:chorismate-binding protein [bacterium]
MSAVLPRLERDEFDRIATKGATVAVHRTALLDGLTPVAALTALRREGEPCFLLESATGGERIARFSFLGAAPTNTIHDRAGNVMFQVASTGRGHDGDVLHALRRSCLAAKAVRPAGLPRFAGGFVGFLGWDMARASVGLKRRRLDVDAAPADGLPDALFHRFDDTVAFDHLRGTVVLMANVECGERGGEAWKLAQSRLDYMEERLAHGAASGLARPAPVTRRSEIKPLKPRAKFEESVAAAKKHIIAGDVFQIVLSRGLELETDAAPLSVYRALRAINPSPYLFYLETGGAVVMGSSPELLVRVEDGRVHVRPIAGTRRRGLSPEEDRALELELLEDEKERAEHLMLVDLGRNDVGQVAKLGTVSVDELMTVERYSHVMHLVSNISGELDASFDRFDALKAGFPAGTVSGAPKRRAVELLAELEGDARGLYAGTVGYVDLAATNAAGAPSGLDTCIAIRTLVQRGKRVLARAGAGIVYDSDPSKEFEETEAKARALLEAVRLAEEGLRP